MNKAEQEKTSNLRSLYLVHQFGDACKYTNYTRLIILTIVFLVNSFCYNNNVNVIMIKMTFYSSIC